MSNGASQPPGSPRHLTRSSRHKMVAGVCGGLAEYFDVDPVLIRISWVAATPITHGLAIPLYIILWILMPRDDRAYPAEGADYWQEWSGEFRAEAQRVAAEARRVADDVTGRARPPEAATHPPTEPTASVAGAGVAEEVGAATEKDRQPPSTTTPPTETPPAGTPYDPYAPPPPDWEPRWRHRGRDPRHRQHTAGLILVGLGVILLASEAGWFAWIQWNLVWPALLVIIGVALLLRRTDWR